MDTVGEIYFDTLKALKLNYVCQSLRTAKTKITTAINQAIHQQISSDDAMKCFNH